MNDDKIVIVVKKPKKHGGHHGGSWKVAYADFVTAMMAFFLVMWIVGMDSDVKDLVQGYFNNPVGFRQAYGAGATPISQGSSPLPVELRRIPLFVRQVQQRRFQAVRDELVRDLNGLSGAVDFGGEIEVVLTPDGLRVELREGDEGDTFFTLGSDEVTPSARQALAVIAENLEVLPNDMVIEGHTDASTYGGPDYTNWELSSDRANAARKVLVDAGLDPSKIHEIRGHADRQLLLPDAPLDPANRRVTILIPYLEIVDTPDPLLPSDTP